jgi:hypothetical protein
MTVVCSLKINHERDVCCAFILGLLAMDANKEEYFSCEITINWLKRYYLYLVNPEKT